MADKRKYRDRAEYLKRKVKERRKYLRQKALDYKGGKCQICGYSRCPDALELHHVDPTDKDFALSQ